MFPNPPSCRAADGALLTVQADNAWDPGHPRLSALPSACVCLGSLFTGERPSVFPVRKLSVRQ